MNLLETFVAEAADLLELVDSGLLALEAAPADREALDRVFRAAHTFKGSSGLFDLPEITRLTHAAEDLLDAVRADRLALTREMVDDLLAAFDLVRAWVRALDEEGAVPAGAAAAGAGLAARLRGPLGGDDTVPGPRRPQDLPAHDADADVAPVGPAPQWLLDAFGRDRLLAVRGWLERARTTCRAVRWTPGEQSFYDGTDPLHLVRQVPAVEELVIAAREPWPALAELDEYRCVLDLTLVTRATPTELADVFLYVGDEVETAEVSAASLAALLDPATDGGPTEAAPDDDAAVRASVVPDVPVTEVAGDAPADVPADVAGDLPAGRRTGPADRRATGRVLRVEQATVDRLMDLVGQLVVAKNGLPYLAEAAEHEHGARGLARQIKDQYAVVDRITEDLQGAVMDVRMLPLSVAFARFPRMVRDLARALGKDVVLEQRGEDTAADKDVIEMLADPLVHLVRNSLDHGVEAPDVRLAAGKPARATLTLAAHQEPDAVVLDVVDDGRGIDPDAVRRKAVERGVVTADEAAALTDDEAVQLVFRPGFSTAETVSDVSGRGVGMDAVRASIEATGGTVTLSSVRGEGSRVRLRLPLSMAVSRVMIFEVGGQRLGVPMDLVTETVRVPRSALARVEHQDVLLLRDTVVPLVDLAQALGTTAAPADDAVVSVLVTRPGGQDVGLVVDDFAVGAEVIVKPLDGILAGTRHIAGTALMGDGSVLLVLDVQEVL